MHVPDSATALGLGIAMIHQELSPVPAMTVAENIYLGREPLNRLRLVDKRQMIADAQAVFESWQIDINPRRVMKTLSVAQMQMVEIAKAISTDARLIIMDEPTSAITEREVEHLHRMIRSLRESGVAIIYITHKMDEVFKIADKVTVFRDGRHVATLPAARARPPEAHHADGRPRAHPPVPQGGRPDRRGGDVRPRPDPPGRDRATSASISAAVRSSASPA